MDTLKTSAASGLGKVGEGFGKVAEVAKSPFSPGIPVVEAREKDLKDLPLGHEQAVAYKQQQSRRSFWIFGGPVNFKEPTLPDVGGMSDGGLLPAKVE